LFSDGVAAVVLVVDAHFVPHGLFAGYPQSYATGERSRKEMAGENISALEHTRFAAYPIEDLIKIRPTLITLEEALPVPTDHHCRPYEKALTGTLPTRARTVDQLHTFSLQSKMCIVVLRAIPKNLTRAEGGPVQSNA
jgi:hypothetical protein